MKKVGLSVVSVCVMALALMWLTAGCGQSEQSASPGESGTEGKLNLVATVGMVGDIVRNVAGDRATVSSIIGEGVDPHLYSPTRADVVTLSEADVIFYVGLNLEGKMTDVLTKVGKSKPVFAVTENIDPEYLLDDPEYDGAADPHIWMDVSGWMKAVQVVADSLAEVDPANAETYQANAEAYLDQLAELDAYAKEATQTIPEQSRLLITAHDAFGYLGRAYGLEVEGIQGLSTESEAGLKDVNQLVDLIVERQINAIFVETSVAEKNIQALIDGAKSRGKSTRIGGSLFSDAMGEVGTYEGTYIGMIDHNITTIVRALGGEAPRGGFQGKLSGATETP